MRSSNTVPTEWRSNTGGKIRDALLLGGAPQIGRMRQVVTLAGKRNLYFGHRQFRLRVATALQKRQHSPALQNRGAAAPCLLRCRRIGSRNAIALQKRQHSPALQTNER